jgi:ribonuclease VapC
MAAKVLDGWALMAFLKGESAAEEVGRHLERAADGKVRLMLCVVNWGEVYYGLIRAGGEQVAEVAMGQLATLPIEVVPVSDDLHLVREAAKLKAKYRMSYADCFAAALAKIKNAELVTGDPEFRQVQGDVRISWLRAK